MNKDRIRIGLIGFGNVGLGVARILIDNEKNLTNRAGVSFELAKVAVRDASKSRALELDSSLLTEDPQQIVDDATIDIVVEVMGGVDPARTLIEAALRAGKHVVTSNKEVIAKHGLDFITLAREHDVNIYYEGAVGGAIPIIHAIKNSLSANNVEKVFGIMNGTTNYILTKMYQEGADFEDTLREAQALGFAELDPTDDVDGYDVAYKLSILASIAFNTHFAYEDIYFEGIRHISARDIDVAKKLGFVIKLVAIGIEHSDGKVELRVHPAMIDASHPLAGVNGSFNAVFVKGNYMDETMFYGPGAGELPTASAVVGDIMDIAMHFSLPNSHPSILTNFTQKSVVPMGDIRSEFYFRLTVKDEPGVLASIAQVCGDAHVSIKSVEQREPENGLAELIIITHEVEEKAMQCAIEAMGKRDSVSAVNALIRVGL